MDRNHAGSSSSAGAAIEDMLRAERDALQAIEVARGEAQAIVARATEHAQRITRRCETKIQRVHEGCAAALDRELQRLHALDGPMPDESGAEPATRPEVEAAVARLAASLTSPGL